MTIDELIKERSMAELIKEILEYSQDNMYPDIKNVQKLVDQWDQAKQRIRDTIFNGSYVLKSDYPIKVQLSEEQRNREFSNFLLTLDENDALTPDFERFLTTNKSTFFENRLVNSNEKLSKLFKRYIDNESTLRWAQDKASEYIQKNKLEGYFYYSIDPIDFLILSDNAENWRSCHALDGDFRAGNLSYMTDEVTFMVYLADEKEKHINMLPFPWRSKKWRMLIHINKEGTIYYNKQYPYASDELLDMVHADLIYRLRQPYTQHFSLGLQGIRVNQTSPICTQLCAGGRCFDARDVFDTSDYRGYCDLVSSSSYLPIAAVPKDIYDDYYREQINLKEQKERELFHKIFDIKIGEKVICPVCGKHYLDESSRMMCEECNDETAPVFCEECGRRIDDDKICWIDDDPFCPDCYEEEMLIWQ